MLTRLQLRQLRNEITINSLFLKDYSNTLDIDPKKVYNFFDSFLDYIFEERSNGLDFYDVLDKYDNISTLYDYYLSFTDDPLSID